MNRRRFIRWCAGAGAVLFGGLPAEAAQVGNANKVRSGRRVIVVGTGLCGLQAARVLAREGCQVTVLEARDRLGGRAWTSRLWADLPVDLGASWIHGVHSNPLVALAKEAGARPVPFDYERMRRYWSEGGELTDTQEAQVERLVARMESALSGQRPDVKASEVLSVLRENLTPPQRRLLSYAYTSQIEHELGTPADEVSVAGLAEGDEVRGGDMLFPGQTGLLTEELARQVRRLGGQIRLGTLVGQVQLTARGVSVQTEKGHLEAEHLILTAPLGVLQTGQLGLPRLPSALRYGLQELKMGSLEKLVLRFPRVFWPPENLIGRIPAGREEGQWVELLNLHRFMQRPALMLFNGGVQGRWSSTQDDRALIASAMSALRRMFPGAPDPVAAQRSRWARDPLSLGSYSFATGKDPEAAREALQEPIGGRIWLAGEHTSVRAPQTMHGAYLEGERAARNVLDA